MKQIVAVRLDGGRAHKHIVGVAYVDPSTRPVTAGTMTISGLLKRLDAGEEFIVVDAAGDVVEVIRVKNDQGERYVRTRQDGILTDNLLDLPRYRLD